MKEVGKVLFKKRKKKGCAVYVPPAASELAIKCCLHTEGNSDKDNLRCVCKARPEGGDKGLK